MRKRILPALVLALAFSTIAKAQLPPTVPNYPAPPVTFPGASATLSCNVTGGSGLFLYVWSQIYGPAQASNSGPNNQQTTFAMTTPGTYQFRCTFVDMGAALTSGVPVNGYQEFVTTMGGGYAATNLIPTGYTATIAQVPPPIPADLTPPVITAVKRTVNGMTVDATMGTGSVIAAGLNSVPFTVYASDNVAVVSAALYVDGALVPTVSVANPSGGLPAAFAMTWSVSGGIPTGSHNMSLSVYDNAGNHNTLQWIMTRGTPTPTGAAAIVTAPVALVQKIIKAITK